MKYALEHNGFHQRETFWRSQKWTMNHKWALNYNKVGNKEMVFSSMSPYGRSLNSLRLSPMWNHTKDRRKEEKKKLWTQQGVIFLHKQFISAYWRRSRIGYSRGAQSPPEDDEK